MPSLLDNFLCLGGKRPVEPSPRLRARAGQKRPPPRVLAVRKSTGSLRPIPCAGGRRRIAPVRRCRWWVHPPARPTGQRRPWRSRSPPSQRGALVILILGRWTTRSARKMLPDRRFVPWATGSHALGGDSARRVYVRKMFSVQRLINKKSCCRTIAEPFILLGRSSRP